MAVTTVWPEIVGRKNYWIPLIMAFGRFYFGVRVSLTVIPVDNSIMLMFRFYETIVEWSNRFRCTDCRTEEKRCN